MITSTQNMDTVQYICLLPACYPCLTLPHPFPRQIVITSTQNMNTVQYIFAAVEGGVCSALAMAFIIASTAKMNLQVRVSGWVWVDIEVSSLGPRPQRNAI